jgi:hypothetical protein
VSGGAAGDPADLVDIHVLRLPVAVWAQAQEHSDALMREFALIASDAASGPEPSHVPARLLQLVEMLNAGYAGFTGEQEAQLHAAVEAEEAEIDLHYRVPRSVGPAAQQLGGLLDEADDYCRAGQHLLTLTTPPEQVRFRRWFLDQFTDQAAGLPPVAWPDYR